MDAVRDDTYTVKDIFGLPEGERAELIDGVIYDMSSPSLTHQSLSGDIFNEIKNYVRKNRGDCKVYYAPFAVFLFDDDRTYLEPDLVVICDSDKLADDGCHGAPDWVVEIVSPSSRSMDYYRKLFLYQKAGVREYWIVDPDKSLVTVYNFKNESVEQYRFGEEVPVGIYEGFGITVEL